MGTTVDRLVEIEYGEIRLEGILQLSERAKGLVLFAHGSGSGRFSPRNQYVAGKLQAAGLSTLLFDLLEDWESEDRRKVFDIDLLAERLIAATSWVRNESDTKEMGIGYFGASTGAAAALEAAAKLGHDIRAIVSRGGRPDLAMRYIHEVTAPTLLIVGGEDWPVISMNREAYEHIATEKRMEIIPGATHLFEEPGALEEVSRLACEWFLKYLLKE